MQAKQFWIVEYVDVNAPKAERSEICFDKSDARHRALRREAVLHYETLESFAGKGFCDSIKTTGLFDNELAGVARELNEVRA